MLVREINEVAVIENVTRGAVGKMRRMAALVLIQQ
jgi:hypothetical protein